MLPSSCTSHIGLKVSGSLDLNVNEDEGFQI